MLTSIFHLMELTRNVNYTNISLNQHQNTSKIGSISTYESDFAGIYEKLAVLASIGGYLLVILGCSCQTYISKKLALCSANIDYLNPTIAYTRSYIINALLLYYIYFLSLSRANANN